MEIIKFQLLLINLVLIYSSLILYEYYILSFIMYNNNVFVTIMKKVYKNSI